VASLRISESADNPQVNIIYRDCITGRLSPPVFASHTIYIMYNLLCQCTLTPLSLATVESAAAVGSRKGGTTPPSIRSPKTSRVTLSTSVRNSRARGLPRSNVSAIRMSSLASSFPRISASCRLRTSCRVATAVTHCRPQAPDKESRAFAPR